MERERRVRIRLLATRFHQLQGLRVAFAGMAYTVVFGSYLVAAEPSEAGVLIALGVSVLIYLPADLSLKRYYASTFGRQVPHPRDRNRTLLIAGGLGFLGSLLSNVLS